MFYFFLPNQTILAYGYIIFSITAITLMGVLDDLYHIRNFLRFAVQSFLAIFFLQIIGVEKIFWLPTIIFIVYFINSYNFMDGIDIIAASQAIFMSSILLILTDSFSELNLLIIVLSLGFLCFNYSPAKLFLGSAGSYFYGMFFIILFINLIYVDEITIFTAAIIYSLFLTDTIYSIIVRFLHNYSNEKNSDTLINKIFSSTKFVCQRHVTHNYQKLTKKYLNHTKVCLILMAYNILFCAPLAYISHNYNEFSYICFILSIFPYIMWCNLNKAGLNT